MLPGSLGKSLKEFVGKMKSDLHYIHQFHYYASPADAISDQMQFIKDSLKEIGIQGEIFACEIKSGANYFATPWNSHLAKEKNALLLIHHSQGNPLLQSLLAHKVKKAVVYHNITPSTFLSHDPVLSEISILGRSQLNEMSKYINLAFSDSKYNSVELKEAGFKNIRLLPLFDCTDLKTTVKAARLKDSVNISQNKASKLLFVGRNSPHKRQDLIIKTLYYLIQLNPNATLTLIGKGDPVYERYLKDLIKVLRLEKHVTLTGSISKEERDHYYYSSDAFLCLSEHEGYCIPIAQAMAWELPIFSVTDCALRETLGDAGVQLKTQNPSKIAAIIHSTLNNEEAVEYVIYRQREQLKLIEQFQNKATVQDTMRAYITK